jgi:hypothetical protein
VVKKKAHLREIKTGYGLGMNQQRGVVEEEMITRKNKDHQQSQQINIRYRVTRKVRLVKINNFGKRIAGD